MKRTVFVILLMTLCFAFSSCTTSMRSIAENPQRFSQKVVTLKGRVNTIVRVPFTEYTVFVFESEGVKTVVFTDDQYPKGEEVNIKAEVVTFPEAAFKDKSGKASVQIAAF